MAKWRRHPVEDDADAVLVQVSIRYIRSCGVPYRLVAAK